MRRRVKRLECTQVPDTLLLADGEEIRLRPGERLEALLAAVEGREHHVHGHLQRLAPGASEDAHELAELIAALQEPPEEGNDYEG